MVLGPKAIFSVLVGRCFPQLRKVTQSDINEGYSTGSTVLDGANQVDKQIQNAPISMALKL